MAMALNDEEIIMLVNSSEDFGVADMDLDIYDDQIKIEDLDNLETDDEDQESHGSMEHTNDVDYKKEPDYDVIILDSTDSEENVLPKKQKRGKNFKNRSSRIGLLKLVFGSSVVSMNPGSLALVAEQCEKFGWTTFSSQLVSMFKKVGNRMEGIKLLDVLIGDDILGNLELPKKQVIHSLLRTILEKFISKPGEPLSNKRLSEIDKRAEIEATQEKEFEAILYLAQRISYSMKNLLQLLFTNFLTITKKLIPIISSDCDTYGWKPFEKELPAIFLRVAKPSEALKLLDVLIGEEKPGEMKEKACSGVFDRLLEKFKEKKTVPLYVKSPKAKEEEDQKSLYFLCEVARKINFNLAEFLKTKPINVVVPVLIKLANSTGKKVFLEGHWLNIANYFIDEMEEIQKRIITVSWRLPDAKVPCRPRTPNCKDCQNVEIFLRSDRQSQGFKIGKRRRSHVHNKLFGIANLDHYSAKEDITGLMFIKKTRKTGQDEIDIQNFAIEYIKNLRGVVPEKGVSMQFN